MAVRYNGAAKLAFQNRLADSWRDLSTVFEVPSHDQRGFARGREADDLWQWIESRSRLSELPNKLRKVDRGDLADALEEGREEHTNPIARASRRAKLVTVTGLGLGVVGVVVVVVVVWPGSASSSPPRGRTVIVQNQVTDGASAMREDSTPAYLSTEPVPYCKKNGCAVPHTDMWSGAKLIATCQEQGAGMTNGFSESTIDDHNPGLVNSRRWYKAWKAPGQVGYIAETLVRPDDRGGLGLPNC